MREDAVEGSRPKLGRRPDPKPSPGKLNENAAKSNMADSTDSLADANAVQTGSDSKQNNKQPEGSFGAKIQTVQPAPSSLSTRPTRSTRNPNPQYVDGLRYFVTPG